MSEDPQAGRRARGELQQTVLQALWSAGRPLTASQLLERLPDGLAYTTVLTILTRLTAKGELRRSRAGRGYAFEPVLDEAAHTAGQMRALLGCGADREAVLSRFVSDLSVEDEELLHRLLGGDAGPS
jgi:predicted transcriptional regulator